MLATGQQKMRPSVKKCRAFRTYLKFKEERRKSMQSKRRMQRRKDG